MNLHNVSWLEKLAFSFDRIPKIGSSISSSGPGCPIYNTGAFGEAADLIASYHGGDFAISSSEGTTRMMNVAIEAVRLSCDPQRKPRLLTIGDNHLSVLTAAAKRGFEVQLLPVNYQPDWEVLLPASTGEIRKKVTQIDSVDAIVVTCPSYQGFHLPKEIAPLLRQTFPDAVLIHDNAWGVGQPCLSYSMPDILVRSLHKMSGSFQPGSVLIGYTKNGRITKELLRRAMLYECTTSPSQPVLVSNAVVIKVWEEHENEILNHLKGITSELSAKVTDIGFPVLDQTIIEKWIDENVIEGCDPGRVMFNTAETGMYGFKFSGLLEKHGIVPERSGFNNVGLLCTIGHDSSHIQVAADVISNVRKLALNTPESLLLSKPESPRLRMPCHELNSGWHDLDSWYKRSHVEAEHIMLEETVGRVAMEFVVPYPPGRPVLIPGQRVSQPVTDYLLAFSEAGGECIATDRKLKTVLCRNEVGDRQ